MKGKTHDLNHNLKFSAHIINCVCHSIRSMFRVLGIYNFGPKTKLQSPFYVSELICRFDLRNSISRRLTKSFDAKPNANEEDSYFYEWFSKKKQTNLLHLTPSRRNASERPSGATAQQSPLGILITDCCIWIGLKGSKWYRNHKYSDVTLETFWTHLVLLTLVSYFCHYFDMPPFYKFWNHWIQCRIAL